MNGAISTVILAAGLGTRLREVSDGLPKAMVKVAGLSLLDHSLKFASALSPDRILVVGGFQIELLKQHVPPIEASPYRLLENVNYWQGNLYSVITALPELTESFYITNADHIFPPESAHLFSTEGDVITIFADRGRTIGDDDMKVKLGPDGGVRLISKTLEDYDHGYIGVTFVPTSAMLRYREACSTVWKADPDVATAERVIQYLCDQGERVECRVIDRIKWFEVDTPFDFEVAEYGLGARV